ncbi:MAG TPA: DUF1592 domain-containing protein, partial [Polyangiaceae bacterium]|nr:DUF1592 domain-containing protein [Polyangiaceae bacterium]
MKKLRLHPTLAPSVLGLVVACSGTVGCSSGTISGPGGMQQGVSGTGSSSGAVGGSGAGSGSSVAGTGNVPPPPDCATATGPLPGRSPLRRLSLTEYLTTVNDLLGVDTKMVAMNFPPDQLLATQGAGFSNNADALVVSDTLARAYQTAAETFAAQAVANLAPLLGCDPATGDACAKTFIASFGRRAFRRPMTADEQTAYFTLFKTGSTAPEGTTFADGISLVLQTFLQSPNFLYRVEHGAPATPTAAVAPVTSFEMATRLSYFFWGTGPDNMLLDLAQANQLQTPAQVQMAITTLLKSPRAQSAVSNFHNEWLSLLAITGVTKDATMFPDWTPAIALDMNNEAQTFADQVFWNDGKSDTLFNAPYTFVNAELAKFYGMPAPTGSGFVKVNVDPSRRLGMMMMGGILAFNAKPNQTSPVHRGKFVREQLLCGTVPPP